MFSPDIVSSTPAFQADADRLVRNVTASWFSQPVRGVHQLYVGPNGSGANMHYHGDAWNTLIYGKKKWFFLPPKHATFSLEPAHEFVSRMPARAMQCTQHSGEAVFVPHDWAHATINMCE